MIRLGEAKSSGEGGELNTMESRANGLFFRQIIDFDTFLIRGANILFNCAAKGSMCDYIFTLHEGAREIEKLY